ncbi:MAG: hypothetical protein QOF82_3304 [Frankiales bacterium]|nr:hypothetical protein [Frankiales bacterium]
MPDTPVDPDDLGRRLTDLADRPVDVHRLLNGSLVRAHTRRRRQVAASTVAVVLLAVGIGAGVHARLTATANTPSVSPPPAPSAGRTTTAAPSPTPTYEDVVTPGGRVQVTGLVLLRGHGHPAELCSPNQMGWDVPGDIEGYRAPDQCQDKDPLILTGVDAARLSYRQTSHGVATGWASLEGVWTPGHLTVTDQQAATLSRIRQPPALLPSLTRPPCAAPAGGWPSSTTSTSGTANLKPYAAFTSTHPGVVTSFAFFQPSSTRYVLVIAATNPGAVRASLSPIYKHRLCVVRSRWTLRQVHAAAATAGAYNTEQGIVTVDPGQVNVGRDGQPVVYLFTAVADAAAATAQRSAPRGLIETRAWITPAH